MTSDIKPKDLQPRIPLYHPDIPFVVFWSEKSGCTVLVKWFLWQLGLFDEALKHSNWIHDYENAVFKAKGGYLKDCAKAINDGVPLLKIVRDPYARTVSGYLELCGAHILERGPHWTKGHRKRILEALTGHFVDMSYGFSFRQYVDWLIMQPQGTLDPHIRIQAMPSEAELDIEPLKVEAGRDLYASLEKRFNLKDSSSEDRIFTSGHHNPKTSIAPHSWLGFADLALPVGRKKHFKLVDFDAATLAKSDLGEKIRRYCATDFHLYNYPQFP